jgi:LysR family glycine cleavage system transcriptional activator
MREPDVEVRLLLASGQLERYFASPDVDIAITHGLSQVLPDMRSHHLMTEILVPVCAPTVAGRLDSPEDLAHEMLLQVPPRMGQWRAWMDVAGVVGVDSDRSPRFQSSPIGIEAALAGAGVAIANSRFIQHYVEAGRLVLLFAIGLPSDTSYYLVYQTVHADEPSVVSLRHWLLSTLVNDSERTLEK